jgi:hypothetical protein
VCAFTAAGAAAAAQCFERLASRSNLDLLYPYNCLWHPHLSLLLSLLAALQRQARIPGHCVRYLQL